MNDISHTSWKRLYPAELYELADWLRHLGPAIDRDPQAMLSHLDHPLIRLLCDRRPITAAQRVRMFEALSYGDPGALLSAPGTGLPGVIVRELGSPAQQDIFFDHVELGRSRTFLAVTEPGKGSDAGAMTASLDHDGRLHGEKWLVGHAATGSVGVLMVRTGPGPLSLGAVLLTPDDLHEGPTLRRESLRTVGLRGAVLGYMAFDGHQLNAQALLGTHLHPLQRGMMALIRTFSRFRPTVAALALGHAQAMVDFARKHVAPRGVAGSQLDFWCAQLAATRRLVHLAADEVDRDSDAAWHVPLCKVTATQLCERIADQVPALLGTAALLDHPWLEKAVRDARAFEFMEGTANVHLDNAGAHLARRRKLATTQVAALA
ncbi:acyl-CoA dehydrogenase [Burkholderia sp. Bp8963]|uniref:acyl-CoA dehydrogenase family protein n=1 Tax=Burkholderia sp. Bp8963 TaxID=2184547 RepID=UPI000F59A47F|nr:acyl-CoA dehydrogenase family protein [Burkholderia sp. Bp8963]RQS70482.1 acyl-CoA dehydrogenase [Burkholderia sp. Bp8963]